MANEVSRRRIIDVEKVVHLELSSPFPIFICVVRCTAIAGGLRVDTVQRLVH